MRDNVEKCGATRQTTDENWAHALCMLGKATRTRHTHMRTHHPHARAHSSTRVHAHTHTHTEI